LVKEKNWVSAAEAPLCEVTFSEAANSRISTKSVLYQSKKAVLNGFSSSFDSIFFIISLFFLEALSPETIRLTNEVLCGTTIIKL